MILIKHSIIHICYTIYLVSLSDQKDPVSFTLRNLIQVSLSNRIANQSIDLLDHVNSISN